MTFRTGHIGNTSSWFKGGRDALDETFPSTRPLKISGIEEAEAFLDVQGTNPRARTHQASLDAAIEVTLASVTLEVGGVGGSTMALGAATPKKITLGL